MAECGGTYPWNPIVPVKLTSHPADETRGDTDLVEGHDRDAGDIRHFGIEVHGDSAVRKLDRARTKVVKPRR